MRRITTFLAALAAFANVPAAAQTYVYEEVVEEWVDPVAQRFVSPELAQAENQAIAAYGPFRVLDARRAALVGVTDAGSPARFARMMADFPGITTLTFIDCPGTYDDTANLRLGRMIRAAGLAVEVPAGGSVRSGGVELVLAGTSLTIADGAEFAVHAWLDDLGLSATDYAASAPENARYLAYYRDMGMTGEDAVRFYAMTNSAPFEDALWLDGQQMRGWVRAAATPVPGIADRDAPRLAYLDLPHALN